MMSGHPAIMMKFGQARDESTRKREIQEWVGNDLVEAKPLFPGTDDEELSTLFEVYLKKDCQAKTIVAKLQAQADVEYAHEPADRDVK